MTREQRVKIEEACLLAMYSMVETYKCDTAESGKEYRERAINLYSGRRVKSPDYEGSLFHAKVNSLVATICDITTEEAPNEKA